MERIITVFKGILPRKLICGLRAYHILINLRGQVNRDEIGNTVDSQGQHIPWITYPAIDYLNTIDVSASHVFEFGSGGSSLYWANRCISVLSVEHYRVWFSAMKKQLPNNASIILQEELVQYPNTIQDYGVFDIITIDGAERMRCAQQAVNKLSEGGIIILDNSDWYPNTCEFLRGQGFNQIDFSGFSPQNSFTSTTSIFYQNYMKFPYSNKTKERMIPIGGSDNQKNVLDDHL